VRVLDLAGRHIHVLRTPGVGAGEPVWSRDGQRIVFVVVASEAFDPAWSPNGRVIVFSKADSSGTSLWSSSAAGANPRRIAAAPAPFAYLGRCEFNRAGTRLACVTATEPLTPANDLPHDAHVILLDADGGRSVDLTRGSGFEYGATWSPAGTRLALIRVADDAARIVIVRASDGTQLRVLPERLDPGVYWRLSWSRAQQLALG